MCGLPTRKRFAISSPSEAWPMIAARFGSPPHTPSAPPSNASISEAFSKPAPACMCTSNLSGAGKKRRAISTNAPT